MSSCKQETETIINWKNCVLCQKLTNEKLVKPQCAGYELLGKNISEFHKVGQLPCALNKSLLANLNDLKNIFSRNEAVWHKTCYLKYNNTQLQRVKLRVSKNTEYTRISPPMTRGLQQTVYNETTCLFCELPSTKTQPLRTVMKKNCNDTIIECATVLKDFKILAKVSERHDLIALEAKYHLNCYVEYKNKKNAVETKRNSSSIIKKEALSITLTAIITHINEIRNDSDENPTFSISELAELQEKHMKDLGFDYKVHSSRLKQKLLDECPYLISCDRPGMQSLLTFKDDVDVAIRCTVSADEKSILSEASKIVRSDLFDHLKNDNGVAASLRTLVTMIIFGPNSCAADNDDRVCLFIAELLAYHAIQYEKRGDVRRHNKNMETSAPVYLAAKLYAGTRKKSLINCTYSLGMCISYQKLQTILTEKANSVCEMYHRDGVVCPPKMCKGFFTTAAVDNIDHNPSSTTAKTSFHGTAITLMQHKMPGEVGLPRDSPPISTDMSKNKIMKLPSHYSVVSPCFIDLSKYTCTRSDICTYAATNPAAPLVEETEWLNSTMTEEFRPWAAHHAVADCDDTKRHRTEVSLLPVFTEQAHSPAMMTHSMDIVMKAITFLNPDQVPVLVADQPLYALLKQLQYTLPEKYGEDKIFIMMGGLHVEMAALKVIGQWLKGSGWIEALVEAKVTTKGRSESMLQASNVSRTRYAYEVTVATLYSLMKKAYQSDCDEHENEPQKPFDQWRSENTLIPQFKFWDTALNLIIMVLRFVRSIRSGNFPMYLDSIRKILPWFFALDHVNYARWLSVHLKDLVNLTNNHPELLKHFENGQFVARKSNRKFSGMAFDQAHEQMNAILKGDGGLIGLTENPDAMLKWLLAGPELADMVYCFEHEVLYTENSGIDEDVSHHSDTAANKKNFIQDVKSLETIMNNLGNPFLERSADLYNIDTKIIAPPEVVHTVFNIEKSGEDQYLTFCKERLQAISEKRLVDPIKLNKYPLLNVSKNKSNSKTKAKIGELKNDCGLFSKLYIATCEHRAGDLNAFFAHENQGTPPALSSMGKLRSGTKSDLLKSITSICGTATVPHAPKVSAKILDGSALVHMLSPGQSKNFGEYAEEVFIPFLRKELSMVSRLDIVWDMYKSDSLKNICREKRGIGQKTRVSATAKIPKSWGNFLRDNSNKEGLFHLLSIACQSYANEIENEKEVCITDGPNVFTNINRDTQRLAPCNHEEADTRMMVHLSDAVAQGLTKIMLRTVDTDVVVLAIAQVQELPQLEELWVHIGTGKHHQYLSCHDIATSLGPQRAKVLPLFHSFTGCDTVSCFSGKGKRSAFEAWEAFPALSESLLSAIEGRIEEAMTTIEKYIVILYDRSSSCSTVNECRKYLFTKKDRQLEHIPPTRAALYQHFLRAVYQGVHVWGQLQPTQSLPCPTSWGWTKVDGNWEPNWTDLPVAAEACLEMVRCKCKKKCSARCNCQKKQLRCSELCLCNGTCYI